MTDYILVPGLWLDGASWDMVVPALAAAGHRAHALTLPGLESRTTDRSAITLADQVSAVVRAIDAVPPGAGPVVIVGHSAGAAIAYAAVDAQPGKIARAIYVGGFPVPDGEAIAAGFATSGGDLPLPDWAEFDDADLRGLDDQARTAFRNRAIPSPAQLASNPQRLTDERRYDVPVTVICPEFTSEMLREWIGDGEQPVRELAKIREVEYVDLPAGHWPQFTRPGALAAAILRAGQPH